MKWNPYLSSGFFLKMKANHLKADLSQFKSALILMIFMTLLSRTWSQENGPLREYPSIICTLSAQKYIYIWNVVTYNNYMYIRMHTGVNQLLKRALRKGKTTPGLCAVERHQPPETSPALIASSHPNFDCFASTNWSNIAVPPMRCLYLF